MAEEKGIKKGRNVRAKWEFWRERAYGIGRYGYLSTCAFIKMREREREGHENEIKSKVPKGKAMILVLSFLLNN